MKIIDVSLSKSAQYCGAAATFLSILIPISAFANASCKATIDEIINSLDLEGKTIANSYTVDLFEGLRRVTGSGRQTWVSFKECQGNLVIQLDRSCLQESAYTKGECTIKGLKNY